MDLVSKDKFKVIMKDVGYQHLVTSCKYKQLHLFLYIHVHIHAIHRITLMGQQISGDFEAQGFKETTKGKRNPVCKRQKKISKAADSFS